MTDEYINEECLKNICKIGQGHECCRYLVLTSEGWSCAKHTNLRIHLDIRVEKKSIGARGDNCEGRKSR